jgi:hypothetical protein
VITPEGEQEQYQEGGVMNDDSDDFRHVMTLQVEYSPVGLWAITSPQLYGFRVSEKTLKEACEQAGEMLTVLRKWIPDMEHPEQKAAYEKVFEGTGP